MADGDAERAAALMRLHLDRVRNQMAASAENPAVASASGVPGG
ncbi:hypothetical protein ACFQV4_27925 [Streptomyces thermocarboxydus]